MLTRRRHLLGLSALGLAPALARAAAVESPRRPDLGPLTAAMAKGRFVAYHPTGGAIWNGRAARASDASIEADLTALRPWFDGLITYGALNGGERIAAIASRLGYRAMVQGVWDPQSNQELANAAAAWREHPGLVVGIALGNELVLSRRGTWGDLAQGIRRMRLLAPGVPLATTEPFAQFLGDPESASSLRAMDFMLVNVHPIFENWFFRASAPGWAEFVGRVADRLAARFQGPILIKETGVPTGPAASGFTDAMQCDFYRALEQRLPPGRARAFCYFAAFDLPWQAYDVSALTRQAYPHEGHWGLFSAQRQPKPAIAGLAPLRA